MSALSGKIYVARMLHEAKINAIICAGVRMMVGIEKQSTLDCQWYEGIEYDASEEFKEALENFYTKNT